MENKIKELEIKLQEKNNIINEEKKKCNILIDYYKKEFGIDLRKMGNTTFE